MDSFNREELIAAHGDRCFDCGGPWDQLDHRIPVAAGGSHDLANCRPICMRCNGKKLHASDRRAIADFRAGRIMLWAAAS
ncbi:HNH endonuclease signature motif containing protein [Rhodococcus sp. NPDC047139]|uniref:HNH endonuclease n=1 Tax=Rhodococcus sp. NPDC047139 TaxID=3155141 RepID=UPI0033D78550